LPRDLEALLERLAEHVHDLWALRRMSAGWKCGELSDEAKTHPCLIPYSALSEEYKELDRTTVRGTLSAIIALGYRIVAPQPTTPDRAGQGAEGVARR
jgi:hypothetical protein